MTRALFLSLWIGLGRMLFWAGFICLSALALLRLATWGMGSATLHADLRAPPHITEWHVDHPDFGGLSALLMAADWASLLAGSDHGALITARLQRDDAGQITDVTPIDIMRAKLRSGHAPTEFKMDLEALTRDPRGGWMLAYESYVRIERLTDLRAVPKATHRWETFVPLFGNQAFEALATLPDGRVIAITETKGPTGTARSVIWAGSGWTEGPQIPVSRGYHITGADVGPDGCLYLVERRYSIAGGFRFGLRRLSGGPDTWVDTLLYRAAPAAIGNVEAVSAWAPPSGDIALSLLTDNGFLPLTATRLIELRAAPGAACRFEF